MLHAGLDLSRRRLDYCLLDQQGDRVEVGAAPPDSDGLRGFARGVELRHGPVVVRAAIESMNGARFVHDTLERCGWEVEVADAQKVKGLAPLACKTDRIDAWVLAELSRRDLVPAIWLPGFEQRQERERARWRLFLVRKRSSLKHRVHAQLLAFGHTCPVSDLFGTRGRELLERLDFPEPWRGGVLACVAMIDGLDRDIAAIDRQLKQLGADHRYIPLLRTAPGIAWVLGYTIAAEIGDIHRFSSPKKLTGYTGLCPRVYQSGGTDRRGHLTHAGPKYLRWALMEAAMHACRHEVYRDRYQRNKQRLGISAARRSPRSTSPAAWRRRSGTCSPVTNPSLRQAPRALWPHRRP
ncbi:MAG: IS110 family transposase [Actinobacteria bacterium]|nr:IS110 family transposase [Actinomycetota bacterium]